MDLGATSLCSPLSLVLCAMAVLSVSSAQRDVWALFTAPSELQHGRCPQVVSWASVGAPHLLS